MVQKEVSSDLKSSTCKRAGTFYGIKKANWLLHSRNLLKLAARDEFLGKYIENNRKSAKNYLYCLEKCFQVGTRTLGIPFLGKMFNFMVHTNVIWDFS